MKGDLFRAVHAGKKTKLRAIYRKEVTAVCERVIEATLGDLGELTRTVIVGAVEGIEWRLLGLPVGTSEEVVVRAVHGDTEFGVAVGPN
jgi:hypothetical protein